MLELELKRPDICLLGQKKPMSFQTCSSTLAHAAHSEGAACSNFGKGNTAVCLNTLPAQLLHSLASLTLEACPHTENMPQPHISSILVQRPNHHTCSPSLGSFHNPSSLGPAGLAEQVQKSLLLHICFKHRLLSKAGLEVEFPPPSNNRTHVDCPSSI